MTTECAGNNPASAYASSDWREAFHLLEPIVGRSVSEVLIEDLRENGVDLYKEGEKIPLADIKKTLDWLFGEGSGALLDYLLSCLKSG